MDLQFRHDLEDGSACLLAHSGSLATLFYCFIRRRVMLLGIVQQWPMMLFRLILLIVIFIFHACPILITRTGTVGVLGLRFCRCIPSTALDTADTQSQNAQRNLDEDHAAET